MALWLPLLSQYANVLMHSCSNIMRKYDKTYLAVEQEIAKLLTRIITSAKQELKQIKNDNTGLNKAT